MVRKKINILLTANPGKNETAFISPLMFNKKILESLGVKIRIFNAISEEIFNGNILIISSKVAKENKWWLPDKKELMFSFLQNAKHKVDNILWADLGDSTGATHFEILPFVDKYIKGFLLKNRELYLNKFYGLRIYTDYYHKTFNIGDDDPGETHLNYIPEKKELDKLTLSWNQYHLNYTYGGIQYDIIKKKVKCLPTINLNKFTQSTLHRNILISCRINTNYKRNTISYQRKELFNKLKKFASTEIIGKNKFFAEMRNSKAVISPFGWGEICYRDFEAIFAGAALIKPDCDHLETWPDLYIKNATYLSFKWDFSDIIELVDNLPDMKNKLVNISSAAQSILKQTMFEEEGRVRFAKRVNELTTFH